MKGSPEDRERLLVRRDDRAGTIVELAKLELEAVVLAGPSNEPSVQEALVEAVPIE